MKELCQSCVNEGLGQCLFIDMRNAIVKNLPPSEKQTPIVPNSAITEEILASHDAIATEKVKARARACPQVNFEL